MVSMSKKEYADYVKTKSPNSKVLLNTIKAFLVGGSICLIAQAILYALSFAGVNSDTAPTATAIIMVFIGAFLTGIGIYDYIAKFGGAGTLVPITGFANAIVSPAIEFKSEGIILGMSAKMFTIAGPVLVFGLAASVIYGIIFCIFF